jgi:hypothetical protein
MSILRPTRVAPEEEESQPRSQSLTTSSRIHKLMDEVKYHLSTLASAPTHLKCESELVAESEAESAGRTLTYSHSRHVRNNLHRAFGLAASMPRSRPCKSDA